MSLRQFPSLVKIYQMEGAIQSTQTAVDQDVSVTNIAVDELIVVQEPNNGFNSSSNSFPLLNLELITYGCVDGFV